MLLFFTKFYLSHKYMTLFLYMVLKHKVHKALINIIQLLCRFVKQNYAKNKKTDGFIRPLRVYENFCRSVNDKKRAAKGRPYKFFQNHYRSYPVMRFKSFILIHIFICDVHNIVEPEVFHRGYCCTHAY